MAGKHTRITRGALLALVLIVAGFIGCISIPLGDPEKSKVDEKLVGAWISEPDNNSQTLFTVVPYDQHTCLLTELEFKVEGDKITGGGRLDWKMWLVDIKGTTFVSLEQKNPQLAMATQEDRFASAKIVRDGDTITVQVVKDDFVKNAKVTDSKTLEDWIGANLDNAEMYGDAKKFMRVKDDQKPLVEKVFECFNGSK